MTARNPAEDTDPPLEQILSSFADNLSARAAGGGLAETYQREPEINQVLQALASAGFSQFANTKGIYILRTEGGKQQKIPVHYRELLKGEGINQNIILKPGDTLVVP